MGKLSVILSLFAALGLCLCSPTMAATYDLAADFSADQNPNGVWSYGWTESRGSTFQLAATPGQASSYGTLIGWIPYEGIISPAYAVTDWSAPGEFVPAGTVNLHPGPLGQNSVIRWTAPSAGTYTIQGWFKGNNFAGPTSTDVAILHGTAEIFTRAINSYNVPLNFSLSRQLNAGDTIDFTVGYGSNGNYFSDATGISATITTSYSCTGFEPPFDVPILLKAKVNRAIPLQMQLSSDGTPITDANIDGAPPVVNVTYSAGAGPAVDVTDQLEPVGQSSEGNVFTFDPAAGQWVFHLGTKPFKVAGTYTVTVVAGDTTYSISPTCTGQFVRSE